MGIFSKIFSFFAKKKKVKIIVVGLDNSGKTTLIRWMKPKKGGNFKEVTPTIGYTIETFSKNNVDFTIFDMSGKSNYREMWTTYCCDIDGIIFVIDSSDISRMVVIKNELDIVIDKTKNVLCPILFYANKMDLPSALDPSQCVSALELNKINDRSWNICASNAITGEGVENGAKWIVEKLSAKKL